MVALISSEDPSAIQVDPSIPLACFLSLQSMDDTMAAISSITLDDSMFLFVHGHSLVILFPYILVYFPKNTSLDLGV